MSAPHRRAARQAATLIGRGRLTAERLVEAYLDRIGAFDDTYQAWNTVVADAALARARSLNDPRDHPGRGGHHRQRLDAEQPGHQPRRLLDRLRDRRGEPDGGLQHRHADGWVHHRAVQRSEPDRPQAAMGRVSLHGIVPLSCTRDRPGPLARDAMDAAIMLQTMAGEDPDDPRTQGLPPVPDLVRAATPVSQGRRGRWATRVGVVPGFTSGTSDTARARAAYLDTLADMSNVDVVDVTLPDGWALLTGGAFNNVRLPERTEPFLPLMRQDLRLLGVSVTGRLQGALLGSTEFLTGQRAKTLLLQRVLDDLFAQCDVVVQTDPVPFDVIGLPELALPIGFTATGLPIGTILGGLPFAEDRLLSVAAAYQARTDWHLLRPADPDDDGPAPTPLGTPRRPSAQRPSGVRTAARPRPERGRLNADEVALRSQ